MILQTIPGFLPIGMIIIKQTDCNLQLSHQLQGVQEKMAFDCKPPCCYDSKQLTILLKRFSDSLNMNVIVLPAQERSGGENSWPDIRFWSNFFSCVYGISDGANSDLSNYISISEGRIYKGLLHDALTRYRLRDICAGSKSEMFEKFSLLVLNDLNYELSLTSYFIFKKVLKNNPYVIFVHSPYTKRGTQNDRLVHELATGFFDQKQHKFESLRNQECGTGFTLEFIS